ncbi:MAG: J domain-containing protein [Myxococcaceae bacterium]
MIEVLYFSDREVRSKLFARVDGVKQPLMVTQVRQDRFSRPVPDREPFTTFEALFGDRIDQLVLADEGSTEGMWRDPMGDLAERLFPDDRARAYAAASGYLLLVGGRVEAVLQKSTPSADLRRMEEAASRLYRPRTTQGPSESANPWKLLGIAPGTPLAEAKKSFRNLITQYHPDKVAHLAPEFRELAERRTREILEAWEKVEEGLLR